MCCYSNVKNVLIKKVLIIVTLMVGLIVSYGFGERLAVLSELNNPTYIEIDGNEIYVLDDSLVKVFALKDGVLLRSFGKRGNGPGELMPNDEIPLQMRLVNGQVFLNSQTKFIHYSKTGAVIKEKTTPFMCMQIVPMGKGYAVSKVGFDPAARIFFRLILFDADMKEIKTIHTSEKSPTLRGTGTLILPPNFMYLSLSPDGERLYAYTGRQETFRVHVFDAEGNKRPPIRLDYRCPGWTDSFKKEVMEWLGKIPRFRPRREMLKQVIRFPQFLPAVRNLVCSSDMVLVQTYKRKKNRSEFVIFNPAGKHLKTVFLPGGTLQKVRLNPDTFFTLNGNSYYYLEEDVNNENWILHVQTVSL